MINMDSWPLISIIWDNHHLPASAIDMYVLSLSNSTMRQYYLQYVKDASVFNVTDVAQMGAWSVLHVVSRNQIVLNNTGNAFDWAAKNGYIELLEWLWQHTDERGTTNAMDDAALNGHLDVLKWLHVHEKNCTDRAASNAAVKGHLDVLDWLYMHTSSRCWDPILTMAAAGLGDMAMLSWLYDHGVKCHESAANFAFACGYTEIVAWLEARNYRRSICDADHQAITHIKWLAAGYIR